MRKGDLRGAGLPDVLGRLADDGVSGCLRVVDERGEQASVYLRDGQVYAAAVPGRPPQLGPRLVAAGAVGPDALAEAVEAQRTELQGWRLGELLVHLGLVEQPVVEELVQEQVAEAVTELLGWQEGTWRFRSGERTREDVAPPTPVDVLLARAGVERSGAAADAVPRLSAGDAPADELAIGAVAWSVLCTVDGVRSVGALAQDCGLTVREVGRVVDQLAAAGLLDLDRDADGPEAVGQDEPISQVSRALSALLGPARGDDDIATAHQRAPAPRVPEPEAEAVRALDARRRERDAAELVSAQAELEAARLQPEPVPVPAPDENVGPAGQDDYWVRRDTDTASLLRELSSLGLEDEEAGAEQRPAAQAPRPAAQPRRRKGLFGRG